MSVSDAPQTPRFEKRYKARGSLIVLKKCSEHTAFSSVFQKHALLGDDCRNECRGWNVLKAAGNE